MPGSEALLAGGLALLLYHGALVLRACRKKARCRMVRRFRENVRTPSRQGAWNG